MEPSSAPETPPPDPSPPKRDEDAFIGRRPPMLELWTGLMLTMAVILVWMGLQALFFSMHPLSVAASERLSAQEVVNELRTNGDVIGYTALWSNACATGLVLLMVGLWKRRSTATFLGAKKPLGRSTVIMVLVFMVAVAGLEVLARNWPALQDPNMTKILSSTTVRWQLILGVCLAAPLFEELVMRGLLLGSLMHVWDKHIAVAVTSGIFTFAHVFQYEWPILVFMLLPLAVVLGYARVLTRSIWVPIALHVANNSLAIFLSGH